MINITLINPHDLFNQCSPVIHIGLPAYGYVILCPAALGSVSRETGS